MTTKHTFHILLFVFIVNLANAQSIKKEKMEKLAFMVGKWVGTSKSFSENNTKQIPAYEEINYKLNNTLITLDLMSEALKLHTLIYYDEDDQTYYYCPFSERGTGKYRGEYKDNKFMVWFNESRRLIFQLTSDGYFQEYGESLKEGKWEKYFEDTLKPMH